MKITKRTHEVNECNRIIYTRHHIVKRKTDFSNEKWYKKDSRTKTCCTRLSSIRKLNIGWCLCFHVGHCLMFSIYFWVCIYIYIYTYLYIYMYMYIYVYIYIYIYNRERDKRKCNRSTDYIKVLKLSATVAKSWLRFGSNIFAFHFMWCFYLSLLGL